MNGIHFLTDEKGRRTAAVIDLKKHGTALEEFWDGLIVESRRKEKDIPFDEVRKAHAKRQSSGTRG